MAFPLFRFTLNNTIAGPLVIDEPGGWDDCTLKLERNAEYHSLVEFYDQPLTFYGQDGVNNGGLDYINNIRRSQGPDAQITILVEISTDDGATYGVFFDGLLDIPSTKMSDFYKLECGLIRNDFWSKFINRKNIPIDLAATTDLDGGTRTGFSATTMSLPSQVIKQQFDRTVNYKPTSSTGPDFTSDQQSVGTTSYLLWDNSLNNIDEVEDRFEYGTQISSTDPLTNDKYLFLTKYAGDYRIQTDIRFSIILSGSTTYDIKWYYAYTVSGILTGPTQIGSTVSGTGSSFSDGGAKSLDTTVTLAAGDKIYIYAVVTLGTSATMTYFPDYDSDSGVPFVPVYTTLTVTASTTFPDSTVEAYTIGNAAKSILTKMIGQNNVLKSSGYLESTCGGHYNITKGVNIRGYSLTDKPFTLSFDDLWAGINPFLCLGLGYTKVSTVDKIEIEQLSTFYNTTTVLNLDYVNFINEGYDSKAIFKSVEIGFEKWSAESANGIDDPQTNHVYNTRFKTIGQDIKLKSIFIAASLAIEQTRRNTATITKDWRLDEDVMVISTNLSDATTPELNENFSAVANLNNYTSRYNIRLTPARMLQSWLAYLNGALEWYTSNRDFAFASGEGNITMYSTLTASGSCPGDGVILFENGNIEGGNGHSYLFLPVTYEFEYPLTFDEYKLIRDNPKNAIGVSRTNSGHVPCHIMSLSYKPTHGKATFSVLLGQTTPIT